MPENQINFFYVLTTPNCPRRVARVLLAIGSPDDMTFPLNNQPNAEGNNQHIEKMREVIKVILEGIYASVIEVNPRCPAFNILVAPYLQNNEPQVTFIVFPSRGNIVGGPIDGCNFTYATSLTLHKLFPLFDECSQASFPKMQWLWTTKLFPYPINLAGVVRVENLVMEDEENDENAVSIEELEEEEIEIEENQNGKEKLIVAESEYDADYGYNEEEHESGLEYNYGIRPGNVIIHDRTNVMLFGPDSCYPFLRISGKCKGIDVTVCVLPEVPYPINFQEKFDWTTGDILPANYKKSTQQ